MQRLAEPRPAARPPAVVVRNGSATGPAASDGARYATGSPATGAAVQRAVPGAAPPRSPGAPGSPGTRASATGPATAPAAASGPAATNTSAATATGAAAAPAQLDGEEILRHLERRHIDVLAHRLAGPLGRLLRAEMRLGRERSGRLLDGGR
ncbi:hypothetical protein V1J52_04980 [Streptomyces sp. TRM 70351]|uniref:hypothetical protein n=1 Tax=Streptomyces sp. TRM 70351 TaxID=3116552 RepID=UPI002E7ADBA6|nr:hypothetical protein [Streptomyces sp. TRM 70351]MEE1927547.1 hypothetical protein [Streptomyces sp. TRM 70351]